MKRKSLCHGGPQKKLSNSKPPHQSCACAPNPKTFANTEKWDTPQNEATKGPGESHGPYGPTTLPENLLGTKPKIEP